MKARTRRILWISAAAIAVLALTGLLVAILTVRSDWFYTKVRQRMIVEVEKATGGRAELGDFQFDWRKLRARAGNFVLHGREKAGEPPFVRVANVEVGLRVISALEKDVDLDSLVLERPEVHIIVYPDGSTNIPEPPVKLRRPPIAEGLLKLAVRHFELRDGVAEIREERVPFSIRGDNLRAAFEYDPHGPQYHGHVASRQLHFDTSHIRPAAFDFDAEVSLTPQELRIAQASFRTGRSRLITSGSIRQWDDPRADLTFESNVVMADLAEVVDLPVERTGDAVLRGKAALSWGKGFAYSAEGRMEARGIAYRDSTVRVSGIAARGDFRFHRDGIVLPNLVATALGGTFAGYVEFSRNFERLRVEGNAKGMALGELPRVLVAEQMLPWSGTASGPIRIDGAITAGRLRDFTVQANMNIAPAEGPNPIEGSVDLIFDQAADTVRLGNVNLSTRASRIQASGTLGQTLRVSLESTNLDDLRPGLTMISPEAGETLPLSLAGGAANAKVTISGELANPVVAGHVALGRFQTVGRTFDSAEADFALSRSEAEARNLVLNQRGMRVTGRGRIELRDWKAVDPSAVSASLTLRGGDVQALLADSGQKLPVTGTLTASAEVAGTFGSPQAAVQLTVDHPAAWDEQFDQLRADALVTTAAIQIREGDLRASGGRLQFKGAYERVGGDWNSGRIRFDVNGDGLGIDRFQHVRQYETGFSGLLTVKAIGAARARSGVLDLDSLDGEATLSGIARGKAPVGKLTATARTRGDVLDASIEGSIRGNPVKGSGEWKLEGDYPGRGDLQFTGISFAALHEIIQQGDIGRELPFVGVLDGHIAFSGPLKKPDAMRAEVVLPRVQVNSNTNQELRAGARLQDLVVRNTEPVRLLATTKAVDIQSARFAATDTSLEASGRVAFDAKSPWDVGVRGRMNLAILQLFNSDLAARGNAVLNTTIRGSLNDPQVGGRLELNNASLYLADLPPSVGVDNANGLVTFDRNRATIEKLTAEVGGGRISFGGFIGFGGGILVYRVQGQADQVRLRHPDGISVTLNAVMNLTGTSESGLISGTVTVMRAAFETHADLGSLLAQSSKPLPAPSAPNEYLRGLNFDIRVESGPNLEVQTSLTRDLETELELRLRGNAARPNLSGDISVNQGEIQFLGNKYTVNRADIRFINPTKLEPVFDVDLETKARGITVNIAFSGTMNKLNATYRSDPPLQSSDIIALLAVGRDPTTAAVANAQTRSNLLETGASTLSQAVAAPVSNRLQRFFGVSRLKIDPSLTGVENIPQARVTLEQQVSRDITLTYITNFARTQEQIVRIQWDINRRWSAIAIREENGVFGIDFQYRKRF